MWSSLHVHTVFSYLDGLCSSEELAKRASEIGIDTLAITDHGTMSGIVKHQLACKKYRIKAISGVEAYFTDDVNKKEKSQILLHVTLLAKSNHGLKSLFHLMTQANSEQGFYYKPRIDLNRMCECQDIIILTGCGFRGLFQHENFRKVIEILNERFPQDVYLEMMPLDLEFQHQVNKRVAEFSEYSGLPIAITNDVHYAMPEQAPIHDFLLAMNTGGKLSGSAIGLHLQNESDIRNSFRFVEEKRIKEGIRGTKEITDKCHVEIEAKDVILPKLVGNADEFIKERAFYKLEKLRLGQEYRDRLEYELDVISEKDFSDYFVLVQDICSFARGAGFEMGAGRGSSGGSLLCYLLGITEVDPLRYGLIFERFLNKSRTDAPDVDTDVEDERREEIIEYLRNKFGEDRVANISTFSVLKPRSAFKDVAKAMGIPYAMSDSITKLLPEDMGIKEAMESDGALRQKISALPEWGKIVEYADSLVGTYRQPGRHAAGIIVSPIPLEESCILERRGDARIINFDMEDSAFLGWTKVDILGLRTLSILSECKRLIWERHGVKINWQEVDLEDPRLFEDFSAGNTVGIFQFESQLLRELLKKLAPIEDFDILVHATSIARPGPMDSGMTEKYIARKRGELIPDLEYAHWIADIIQDTQSCILFQEQIIQILQSVAGYTTPQADLVRRIVAKSKGKEEFQKHESEFVEGCYNHSGMPRDVAQQLFSDLEAFSRYSFNKSHACAYTLTALRQMFLKVYYPVEYMTALFRKTEPSQENKILEFVQECSRFKIAISMPDINHSGKGFSIKTNNEIVAGLEQIKNVGPKVLESIIKARKNGPFESVQDFRVRVPKANKRVVASLLQAGAFDSIGANVRIELSKLEGREETGLDYTKEEKMKERVKLLPQLWQPTPEVGMKIDRERLEKLADVIRNCKRCHMWEYYQKPVPFEFYDTSRIMVIAEAPGGDEVRERRPLIGKAGQLLTRALKKIGIKREMLYLSNIYKCRPQNNALADCNPPPTCHSIIFKEIDLLRPKLIIVTGATSLRLLFLSKYAITKSNGQIVRYDRADGGISNVFCLIHPAATFRSTENKERFQEGIYKLSIFLNGNK